VRHRKPLPLTWRRRSHPGPFVVATPNNLRHRAARVRKLRTSLPPRPTTFANPSRRSWTKSRLNSEAVNSLGAKHHASGAKGRPKNPDLGISALPRALHRPDLTLTQAILRSPEIVLVMNILMVGKRRLEARTFWGGTLETTGALPNLSRPTWFVRERLFRLRHCEFYSNFLSIRSNLYLTHRTSIYSIGRLSLILPAGLGVPAL
jgi:hypothetical protein